MIITIRVDDKATQAALQALRQRLANPGPVLKDVGEDIVQRTKARFRAQAGPDGQTWKPKRVKDGRPTLHGESGTLRRQIVWQVAGDTLTVKATAQYAAIHQFGGAIPRQARQVEVRHRTNAKGELLRTQAFNGKGLIFAKKTHKRALTRYFDARAYTINMPARPYLPVRADGTLYPAELKLIQTQIEDWLKQAI